MAKKNNTTLPDHIFGEEGDDRANDVIDSKTYPDKVNAGIQEMLYKIVDHQEKGGTLELVPKDCKAIIVRQEFSPEVNRQVEEVVNELKKITGISTLEQAEEINKTLKKSKRLYTAISDDGLLMRSPLKDASDSIISYERNITGELKRLTDVVNKLVTDFKVRELQKEAEKERKLREKRDEELRLAQAETDRKAKIQEMIIAFENSVLKGCTIATIKTIDSDIAKLASIKINKEKYMEFLPQAEIMYQQCVTRMNERKVELLQLAEAEKIGKENADRIRKQQEEKAKLDLQASQLKGEQKLAELEDEKQSDIANSQMNYELKVSQAQEIKGVQKRWSADFDNIDMSLLPDEYKTFDEKKIKEAITAGCREMPGVKIELKIVNTSR